jgi:hypothetical protein
MTQVWRIDAVAIEDNKCSVGRAESWTLCKDKYFPDLTSDHNARDWFIEVERKDVLEAKVCSNCGRQSKSLSRMSCCDKVTYCKIRCHELHWDSHKAHCSNGKIPASYDPLAQTSVASADQDQRTQELKQRVERPAATSLTTTTAVPLHEQRAREHIKLQTRLKTPVTNLLIDFKDDQAVKDAFLERFCFSNEATDVSLYGHYRRYFLGKPSTEQIKSLQRDQGVCVVSSSAL